MSKKAFIFLATLMGASLDPYTARATPYAYIPFTDSNSNTERVQEMVFINEAPAANYCLDLPGKATTGVVAGPNGRYVYFSDGTKNASSLDTLYILNAARNTEVSGDPKGIAVSPRGDFLYVTNYKGGTLTVLDATQNPPQVIATIPAGGNPWGVAASPDGKRVYVTNHLLNGTVTVFETTQDPKNPLKPSSPPTVPAGNLPIGVGVSFDNQLVFVANYFDKTVSVISGANLTPIKTVDVLYGNPYGIAVHPGQDLAYVSYLAANKVGRVRADPQMASFAGAIDVGNSYTSGIATNADGSRVFVISGDSKLYVLDGGLKVLGSGGLESGSHDILGNFIAERRPILDITPSPLDFGPVEVGKSSKKHVLKFKNSGSLPFSTKSVSPYGPELGLVPGDPVCGDEIWPGKDCTLSYLFSPKTAGKKSVAVTWTDVLNNQATATFTGEGLVPRLEFSELPLVFQPTLVGGTSTRDLVLKNAGAVPLDVSFILPTNIDEFPRSGPTCNWPLPPGGSCTMTFAFNPKAGGRRTNTSTFVDVSHNYQQQIDFNGEGLIPSTLAEVSPSGAILFPDTMVNASSPEKTVTLKNVGTTPLRIKGITAGGDFLQTNDCGQSVAYQGACTIRLRFQPATPYQRTGALTVIDDAPGSPRTIHLKGRGLPKPSPWISFSSDSVDFPETAVGQASSEQTVTVKNTGTKDLVIGYATLDGDDRRHFFIQQDLCTGRTITPSGTCPITLKFRPRSVGDREASLLASDNVSGNPYQAVLVSGTGKPPGDGSTCGNGIVESGEECDDGIRNNDFLSDACRTDCTKARCGDGAVDSGEECDDGNTNNGDACNAICKKGATGPTKDISHPSNEPPAPPTPAPARPSPALSAGCSLIY